MNNELNNVNQDPNAINNGTSFQQPNGSVENVFNSIINMQTNVPTSEPAVEPVTNVPVSEPAVDPVKDEGVAVSQPVKKERIQTAAEKNFKLTSTLLIIFFVILLIYILVMPYVGEWILIIKDKLHPTKADPEVVNNINNPTSSPTTTSTTTLEPKENEESNLEELSNLVCTGYPEVTDTYIKNVTRKYEYNKNNEVINYSEDISYSFTADDSLYEDVVNSCNASLKYLNHPGFTVSCNINESDINIGYSFELNSFKNITDSEVDIKSDVLYKEKIDSVKAKMLEEKYTCE